MPRRAAAGHNRSMQAWKLAAAARIASAVISGGPEPPDSPLHSGAACAGGGRDPVVLTGPRPLRASCAATTPQAAVTMPAAMTIGHALRMPVLVPTQYPPIYGCLDIISAALMVYFP